MKVSGVTRPPCGRGQGSVRGRRNAFTLIELLIVAAIIAILMAVVVPRYLGGTDANGKRVASPRERAQQVVGVSYIGQINAAISLYRSDNDGQNPPDLFALQKYGVTGEMLLDPITHKALTYDPQTGIVGNSTGQSNGPDSMGGGATLPGGSRQ